MLIFSSRCLRPIQGIVRSPSESLLDFFRRLSPFFPFCHRLNSDRFASFFAWLVLCIGFRGNGHFSHRLSGFILVSL